MLDALGTEQSSQPLDSMLAALGRMKSKQAIPALAVIIRADSTDVDTQWTAVEALGHIARRRFLKEAEPVLAARAWLDKRGV